MVRAVYSLLGQYWNRGNLLGRHQVDAGRVLEHVVHAVARLGLDDHHVIDEGLQFVGSDTKGVGQLRSEAGLRLGFGSLPAHDSRALDTQPFRKLSWLWPDALRRWACGTPLAAIALPSRGMGRSTLAAHPALSRGQGLRASLLRHLRDGSALGFRRSAGLS